MMNKKGVRAMVPLKKDGVPNSVPGAENLQSGQGAPDAEKMQADMENRKIKLLNEHIQRIQKQIDSKKPGDPAIEILMSVIEKIKNTANQEKNEPEDE